jgi:dTDP-4-amino-4,6-dideoxy-D-galactose acyltransferase
MTAHENGEDSAGWVRLPWDSSHFGFPIGRLLPSSISEADLDTALRSAGTAGIRCLYWLSDPIESQAEIARRAGFKKVDVRVELGVALGSERPPRRAAAIREAEELDLDALRFLASKSHRNTRFYSDGSFPTEKADALYAAWIERSFRDPNQLVYVSGPAAEPFGYIAFGVSESGEGEIGLIAVDESRRGHGLGSALVGAALARLASQGVAEVGVVTQGQNEPARRLYTGMGFAERNRFFWFHRWFDA